MHLIEIQGKFDLLMHSHRGLHTDAGLEVMLSCGYIELDLRAQRFDHVDDRMNGIFL